MTDFIFLGSKITTDSAEGSGSHEIKGRLLLGRKSMTNIDSVKSRDFTLPTKVSVLKAVVFQIVMYGRGSAGEYQADERAGVARLSWRVSGR